MNDEAGLTAACLIGKVTALYDVQRFHRIAVAVGWEDSLSSTE